jgi:hypothetical protein
LVHVSFTINHHQADISLHGLGMFSASVWDLTLHTFSVWNYKHLDDKTAQYFNILADLLSEIICNDVHMTASNFKEQNNITKVIIQWYFNFSYMHNYTSS